MYGAELTTPTRRVSCVLSEPMPKTLGKDKLAPLEPVYFLVVSRCPNSIFGEREYPEWE